MSQEEIWLEGEIAVEAALLGGCREVRSVYIQAGSGRRWEQRFRRLKRLTDQVNVSLRLVDEAFLLARVKGQTHGGVVAAAGLRTFSPLPDLVSGQERPFVVMLDGIEDPYNFGQALRSLYAAGVSGVVVRPRNWFSAAAVVARASAGASERIPIAVADTAEAAAETFRRLGLQIAATSNQQAISIFDARLVMPLFLLLGGEKRGVTRSFLATADLVLQIPYRQPNFRQSLGVVASAAVVAFEVMRQRAEEA